MLQGPCSCKAPTHAPIKHPSGAQSAGNKKSSNWKGNRLVGERKGSAGVRGGGQERVKGENDLNILCTYMKCHDETQYYVKVIYANKTF